MIVDILYIKQFIKRTLDRQTEDYTAWAVEMVRTMLSAATTAQFLCLAAAPRDL